MASTLNRVLTRGRVLSGDPRNGILAAVDIRIRDGVVVEMAPDLRATDEEVTDLDGRWVLPGFVDAHHHGWHAAVPASTVDSLALEARAHLDHVAQQLSVDDFRAMALASSLAHLESGVTTVLDHLEVDPGPSSARAALEGFAASGIRGWWCTAADRGPDGSSWDAWVDDASQHRVRLATAVLPETSMGDLSSQLRLARERGSLAVLRADPRTGPGIELSQALDASLVGPGQLYVSCSTTAPDELDRAVRAGAGFASTPDMEMAWGEGYPMLKHVLDQGADVGLGSGSPTVVGPDPFGIMRMGLESERGRYQQLAAESEGTSGIPGIALRCADVLHAATLGGAAALGLAGTCGSIQVGKAADLVVIDPVSPRLTPIVDPIVAIVLHLTVADISDVLVAGHFVKQAGRLTHPDLGAVLAHLQGVASALAKTESVTSSPGVPAEKGTPR